MTEDKNKLIINADRPENIDLFNGAHTKISDALYDILTTEGQEGISIGLDGPRGSGKSTVINILENCRERFPEYDCSREYRHLVS